MHFNWKNKDLPYVHLKTSEDVDEFNFAKLCVIFTLKKFSEVKIHSYYHQHIAAYLQSLSKGRFSYLIVVVCMLCVVFEC